MAGSSRPKQLDKKTVVTQIIEDPVLAPEDYEALLEVELDDEVQVPQPEVVIDTLVTATVAETVAPSANVADVEPVHQPLPNEQETVIKLPAEGQKGKRKKGGIDETDRFKKMKIRGTDQELLVDMTRVVKYSDKDKQDHASTGPADFRATIDYGDL